jgi:CheY-like chemotaxis protein
MELEIERVEIPELVKNALTIVGELAAKEGITLAQSIDPAVSVIDADKRKLRQVVYNLLSNAVKFTPPGGTVRVEVTREGSDVVLSFVDTGIGIAPESIPRLFRPFEQLDAGLARKFQGTGLGLVMVKNLVELHGGVVEVESEVGVGSRFWVRLPSSREGARSVMPEARPTTPLVRSTSRSPQVLVIDDDPAAILLARGWLENAGYQVFGASTCDVAWATIQKRPPDIILLDILFEYGPSGWELLGRLRSAPSFAKIPVIVVSIVAELGRGLALGAVQVLQKPVAGADLLDAIASTGITLGEAAHVLVVDDDPRAVEHVSKRLEDAGMVVTRSYGGEDALLALQKRTYAAMVLDLLMPGMNGFDVIRSLRSTDAPPLPIVVLTAKTLDASEQELLERSVHSVLSKNGWDETRFLSVIRKAVHESSFDGAASAPRPKPLRIDDDEGGRGE